MRKISQTLIIAGLLIMAYPWLELAYTDYQQDKTLKEWEKSFAAERLKPSAESVDEYLQLEDVFQRQINFEQQLSEQLTGAAGEEAAGEMAAASGEATTPAGVTNQSKTGQTGSSTQNNKIILGKLIIDKLDLNISILDGTSESNLKAGAGRIKETSNIGEVGNVALAAHRSHTYGRFFNRLDEMEEGDEILIITGKETFVYRVYHKQVVEPTDVSVLNRNNRDKVLTLITCEPIYTSTHRLIVHAVQIDSYTNN